MLVLCESINARCDRIRPNLVKTAGIPVCVSVAVNTLCESKFVLFFVLRMVIVVV